VSTAVNRTANDNPKLLDLFAGEPEPTAVAAAKPRAPRVKREKKDDGQGALF
jgi:hypothetical protein